MPSAGRFLSRNVSYMAVHMRPFPDPRCFCHPSFCGTCWAHLTRFSLPATSLHWLCVVFFLVIKVTSYTTHYLGGMASCTLKPTNFKVHLLVAISTDYLAGWENGTPAEFCAACYRG